MSSNKGRGTEMGTEFCILALALHLQPLPLCTSLSVCLQGIRTREGIEPLMCFIHLPPEVEINHEQFYTRVTAWLPSCSYWHQHGAAGAGRDEKLKSLPLAWAWSWNWWKLPRRGASGHRYYSVIKLTGFNCIPLLLYGFKKYLRRI